MTPRAILLFLLPLLWAGISFAQEKPAPSESPPAAGVREALPRTFYLRDKNGNLVPVPDFSFEEFEELYRLKQKLASPDQPARYILQRLFIAGMVEGQAVAVDIEARIQVKAEGWTRVPLRLNEALLKLPAAPAPKEDYLLEYDAAGDGYVVWLQGKDTTKVIKLKALVPLEQVGAHTRLVLTTPSAPRPTASQLKIGVPNKVSAKSLGDFEGLLETSFPKNDQTSLSLLGVAGVCQLEWGPEKVAVDSTAPVMEVTGKSIVTLVRPGNLLMDAQLVVRTLGRPLKQFDVKIPQGWKLATVEQEGLQVSTTANETGEEVAHVSLESPAADAVRLRFIAEMLAEGGSPLIVTGLHVVGAVRQTGTIDLITEEDYSLNVFPSASISRVRLPAEEKPAPGLAARYEYSRLPFELSITASPRQTRLTVEPLYILYLEPGEARLEAQFQYRVSGGKIESTGIQMMDWQLVNVDSGKVREDSQEVGLTVIDLPNATAGDFSLKFSALINLPAGEPFQLALPIPEGVKSNPSTVVVLPADNVELVEDEKQGLVVDTLPPALELPTRQQPPLFFRDRSTNGEPVFAGEYTLRKRFVSLSSATQIQVGAGLATVQQKLACRVAYEPLSTLQLLVPRQVADSGSLKALLGGDPVPFVRLEGESDEAGPPMAPVQLDLQGNHLGPLEISLAYNIVLPRKEEGEASRVTLPLVEPVEQGVGVVSNQISLSSTPGLEIVVDDPYWILRAAAGAGGNGRVFDNEESPPRFAVTLAMTENAQQPTAAAASKVWVQTWLSPSQRRDRAVFQLQNGDGRVRIEMPAGVALPELQVAVDGNRQKEFRLSPAGMLEIELTEKKSASEHVVELWYALDRPPLGSMQLELPRVSESGRSARIFWQLVVPANEYLWWEPANLTPELSWRLRGPFWSRRATLGQVELEQWCGATSQVGAPEAANQYVFSGFGLPKEIEVFTASRKDLLLGTSFFVLAVGLLFIYVPGIRHPAVYLAAFALLLFAGLLFPEPAAMAAQAAVLGIAALLAGSAAMWMLGMRRQKRRPPPEPSLSSLDMKTTQAGRPVIEESSVNSTATAPHLDPLPADSHAG